MTWANKLAFVLMCATIIVTTLAYGAVHQSILALFYCVVAAIIILLAIDGLKTGTLRFSRNILQIPLLGAAVYGVIQIIPFGKIAEIAGLPGIPNTISLDPWATQVTAFHFFALFIFFAALLVFVDSAKRIRTLAAVIVAFGFVYSFFAVLQGVLSPDKIYGIYESQFATPYGSFVNRHNFAAYIEMTLSIPLGLLFVGAVSKDKRLLYITMVAMMGVALVLSGSRGGLLAFLAEIMLLVLLTTGGSSRGKLALRFGMAALLVLTVVVGAIFVGGESSLTRIAETAASDDVTSDRAHIWSVTLDVITNHLPLGAGLGAFGVAYTVFDTRNGFERVEQAHNDYLQAAADAGIVGIILGGLFIFLLFRIGLRAAKTENKFRRGIAVGALSGCFAILVHSVFDFVLHTTAISILFLSLVALVTASGEKYDDDTEDPAEPKRRKRSPASVKSKNV